MDETTFDQLVKRLQDARQRRDEARLAGAAPAHPPVAEPAPAADLPVAVDQTQVDASEAADKDRKKTDGKKKEKNDKKEKKDRKGKKDKKSRKRKKKK